jgi:hypothetical protein
MTEKIKYGRGFKRTGIFLLVAGTLLGLMSGFLSFRITGSSWSLSFQLMFQFLVTTLLFVGGFLYWRGRQYADKAVAGRVIRDSKSDVLYLRAFGTDPSISEYMAWAAGGAGLISGGLTDEEQLCEALQPFGHLLAIGKPGETLPTPGAARLYASDAEWKNVVIDQMQSARLVVIRAGTSEGLLWELKEAVQVVNPNKLLILILKMRKKHYEGFRKEAEQIFNATFPKIHELKRFWRVSGFVRFSPNWSPNFLPLRAPFFRRGYKPYRRLFEYTLRPVFEEYDLEWKPPPVSILTVSVVVLSSGIIVLILLAVAMDLLHFKLGDLFGVNRSATPPIKY